MDAAVAARRLRAFKRWMRAHGVVCSDALRLDASDPLGVHVRAVAPLRDGDLVATIPRGACLTPRTTGAAAAIEAAELGGFLALTVAVMYERARGADSPWDAYLQLLPDRESVPLVWPADEAECLLAGTELDKEWWTAACPNDQLQCLGPSVLLTVLWHLWDARNGAIFRGETGNLPKLGKLFRECVMICSFRADASLLNSRQAWSFGRNISALVPNTFSSTARHDWSVLVAHIGIAKRQIVKQDRRFLCEDWRECIELLMSSGELNVDPNDFSLEKYFFAKTLVSSRSFQIDSYHGFGMVPLADLFNHKTDCEHVHFTSVSDASGSDADEDDDQSDNSADDQSTIENPSSSPSGSRAKNEDLEMVIVRDVNEGEEVYNTYGTMGNAALLHRYGFTELDNQYDIVNIDLALVTKWCTSIFSSRYTRARVLLWRNLGYSGCTSQDAEYFEIAYDGEPQLELLILLYIINLEPDIYSKLICVAHDFIGGEEHDTFSSVVKFVKSLSSNQNPEVNGVEKLPDEKLLLSESICSALLSLADMRESLYGSNTLADDEENLQACCIASKRKLYHSLVLRVSERRILYRLRKFASSGSRTKKRKHF